MACAHSLEHLQLIARENGILTAARSKDQLCADIQRRLGPLPVLPVDAECAPKPLDVLVHQARELGVPNAGVYNSKTKQELCDKVSDVLRRKGKRDEFRDLDCDQPKKELQEEARRLGIRGYKNFSTDLLCLLLRNERARLARGGQPRDPIPVSAPSFLSTYDLVQIPNEERLSIPALSRLLTRNLLRPGQIVPAEYLSRERGLILFHSVGTGKTFSAINTSQILLRRGLVDRVVVITPTSLQLNFIKQFRDYDPDLQTDTRYQYFTPQQFYLQMAKANRRIKAGERMMLVIDEAHHYRTPIFGEKRVRKGRVILSGGSPSYDSITDYTVSNRVRAIFKFMKQYPVAKVLLLTATPFVNQLYDIENLVAIVENRPPRKIEDVKDMSAFPLCRFHYFANTDPKYGAEFPRKIIRPLYYVMSEDYYRRYLEIEQGLEIPSELYRGGLNQFYNGVRRAANKLDFEVSDKLAALIDMIQKDQRSNPRVRILVYSGWLETGLTAIQTALDERGIRAQPITGRLSKNRRNLAVQAFNGGEINVLLISKAGGEGLDLKQTNKVYILEPTWNDASTQQIIGRAVRYRSHHELEESKRFVEIYYMLLLKPAEGRVLAAGGENARKLLSDPILSGKYAPSLIQDDDTRPSIDLYLTWFGKAKQEVLNRSVEELAKRSEDCFGAIGAEITRDLNEYDRHPLERGRVCFPSKRVEKSGGINRVIIEEDSCAAPSAIDLGVDEQLTDAELKARIEAQIRTTLEWAPEEGNIIEMRIGEPAPYDETYVVSRIESVPKPLLGRFSERVGNLPGRKKIQLVAAYDIDRYRRNQSAIMLTLFYKDVDREHETVFL